MGTFNEEIQAIKEIETSITNNKVANFAYTDRAYTENDIEGVDEFNVANNNNIPIADKSILNVNETVLDKGYRSQASSITRMLVNHFFGRISYNLNKAHDLFLQFLTALQGIIGTPNGIATLDEQGKITSSQLPEMVTEYKGDWNAEKNTPQLADGTGTQGDHYYVKVAGEQDLGSGTISFGVDDKVIYNNDKWEKISSGAVKTVNGKEPNTSSGNVELFADDIKISSSDTMSVVDYVNKELLKKEMGRVWKLTALPSDINNLMPINIYSNGRKWILTYNQNKIAVSDDLENWTQVYSNKANNADIFISAKDGSCALFGFPQEYFYFSKDGITWKKYETPLGYVVKDIAKCANYTWYCIVINNTNGTTKLLYLDEVSDTFKEVTNTSLLEGNITGFPLFTTTSTGTYGLIETDGRKIGYTMSGTRIDAVLDAGNTIPSSYTISPNSLTYANGYFHCVLKSSSSASTSQRYLMYMKETYPVWNSCNMLSSSDIYSVSAIQRVSYFKGTWVTRSNGQVLFSSDAITWFNKHLITKSGSKLTGASPSGNCHVVEDKVYTVLMGPGITYYLFCSNNGYDFEEVSMPTTVGIMGITERNIIKLDKNYYVFSNVLARSTDGFNWDNVNMESFFALVNNSTVKLILTNAIPSYSISSNEVYKDTNKLNNDYAVSFKITYNDNTEKYYVFKATLANLIAESEEYL